MSQIFVPVSDSNIPGDVARSFVTNSGTATPSAGVLNVLGDGSITISAVGNTITEQLTGLTANSVLYGQGTSTIGLVAPGTTGQVLTAVTGLPPVWASAATGTSIIGTANQVLANGTSGVSQTGAVTLTTPQNIATTSDVTFNTVSGPAGSSSAPTYTFTGFTNTGVFRNNNDLILTGGGFATGSFGFNVLLSGGVTTISQGVVFSGISTQTTDFTTTYNNFLWLVDVTTGGAAITVQLVSNPIPGQIYAIKDSTGAAATHNITISGTNSGKTIDGAATLVININYGIARLVYNGTQWNQI